MKDLKLADGRADVVRHGYGPARTIQTGIGPVGCKHTTSTAAFLCARLVVAGYDDDDGFGRPKPLRELCLNLGDEADQAAWLFWVWTTSMPSANLTPAMIFGN